MQYKIWSKYIESKTLNILHSKIQIKLGVQLTNFIIKVMIIFEL